ncbi:hypothetical protein E4656_14715 [Natronospirillum operosum]|uniref:Uncharacterized protein n=1 Tax=Natronospirillum operosum TaxID=2759953 RepID=A0A4Z0WB12_9GAMM|nr:hypothetical protein [Natronospirillum operosum]TGG91650.1 hypothetical protein E4656_14715 [Natronospirillum operosum]
MTPTNLVRNSLVVLTTALAGPASALDYQLGVGLDDNPMLSRKTTLDRPAVTLSASLFDSEFFEQSRSTGYSLERALDVEYIESTPSLSSLSAELGFTRYWQPSPGYSAPWYQLSLSGVPQWVVNSQRHRVSFDSRLSRHQRLTDRVNLETGVLGHFSVAPERVMRNARWGLDAQLGYERRLAGLRGWRGLYLHGSVVSGQFFSARGYDPGGIDAEEKIPDEGLRDDLDDLWWLYRTTGQAYTLTLNSRFQWSSRTAVDLFAQISHLDSAVTDYSRLSAGINFSSRLIDRKPQ